MASYLGRGARWLAHEAAAEITQPYVERGARMVVGAWSARDHARHAYRGAEIVKQDGRRGERMVSAGEWFHGLSDRQAAIGQLSSDFAALEGDLTLHATSPEDAAWVASVVMPTLHDWQTFAERQKKSALSPWVTEWSVFETWQERLRRLRDLARSRGIHLDSPEPVRLPQTVWERGESGTGSGLDAWFGLAKAAIFGVIALTGVVGVVAIAKDLRRGVSK